MTNPLRHGQFGDRMPHNSVRHHSSTWRAALTHGVVCCLLVWVTGCSGLRGFGRRAPDPFGAKVTCRLPANATADQVVHYLNQNVAKIENWRATDVKIRATNAPPLSGDLTVERDHRFRLVVNSLVGNEVDFGSNDQHFWLWMKRQQPAGVYYAAHEDLATARQNLPIPFEPDWLMQALGIQPIDAHGVRLEREPGAGTLKLVSDHTLPNGRPIRREVEVDACHGRVLAHACYDQGGQLLARAILQEHRIDPGSQAILPHYVRLDWPSAGMSLAMNLGSVQVNSGSFPDAMWHMPTPSGTPLVNVGRSAENVAAVAATATAPPADFHSHVGLSGTSHPSGSRSRRQLVEPELVQTSGTQNMVVLEEPEFLPPRLPQRTASTQGQAATLDVPNDGSEAAFAPPVGSPPASQPQPEWREENDPFGLDDSSSPAPPGRARLSPWSDSDFASEPQ
jgi:hypothetical protein